MTVMRLRLHTDGFAPPNHTFKVWRVACENGHAISPSGEAWVVPTDSDRHPLVLAVLEAWGFVPVEAPATWVAHAEEAVEAVLTTQNGSR